MVKKENILNKINSDIGKLEYQIDNAKRVNMKNFIIRKFIKTGIAIDYALPYILSAIIIFCGFKQKGQTPFFVDETKNESCIELIDTSNGSHFQNIVETNNEISHIEYSTAWRLTDYGLYERISTRYIIDETIDLNNIDRIFNMSDEEFQNYFTVIDAEIITEDNPANLDPMYNEDVIIVTRIINTNSYTIEKETLENNIFMTVLYIIITFVFGRGIKEAKRIVFRNYLRNNLEKIEVNYQELDENRIKKMKEILELKKENLSLLEEEEYDGARIKKR